MSVDVCVHKASGSDICITKALLDVGVSLPDVCVFIRQVGQLYVLPRWVGVSLSEVCVFFGQVGQSYVLLRWIGVTLTEVCVFIGQSYALPRRLVDWVTVSCVFIRRLSM